MQPAESDHAVRVGVDLFVETCEAVVHEILWVRRMYPAAMFERRRLYGAQVHASRHPELNQYIATVLVNAKPLLQAGLVDKIVVALVDAREQPLERFVFDLRSRTPTRGPWPADPEVDPEQLMLARVEQELRDLLFRVAQLDIWCRLPPLPDDASFTILVHTTQQQADETVQALQSGSWLAAEARECELGQGLAREVHPLKSVQVHDDWQFEVFLEVARPLR